uniref:ORF3 n=1 Tax=Carrot yellow leaf virus TaxID=656190 RepID=A0A0A0P5N2_9CLOS|nr:ORF3 [Carrot yellow leaf virus]AHA85447.1 ORF3 [Carrot yellow leaf virus]AHA85448.1 ORF3 [Carrot yellow leaf virus]AHA85460.1 ORF3 [Carrot yellow leaf virus]AHA85470.1 ORF3 [Carrot yellow leaf virus]
MDSTLKFLLLFLFCWVCLIFSIVTFICIYLGISAFFYRLPDPELAVSANSSFRAPASARV